MTALFQRASYAAQMRGCIHTPQCPPADAVDHDAARIVADHHDQGWVLLCGGVILFEDGGEIAPDGTVIGPHRAEPRHKEN